MGKKLPDGSVVSSFFNVGGGQTSEDVTSQGQKIIEGQIVKIHYVDDPTNRSKQYVEYDVLARDSYGGSVTYRNCRNAKDYGGTNNYSEEILEFNEVALKGKLGEANSPSNMNGTLVKLAFLENLDKPMIIGGSPHKLNESATRAKGIRKIKEFNGVIEETNKDGEWSKDHIGPKNPDGSLKREDTGPTSFSVDKLGDYEVKQSKSGTEINSEKFERESKKITRKVGDSTVVETWDGDSEKKLVTFKSGLEILEDGENDKVTITTAGGLSIEYNGDSDIVTYTTAGGPSVTIDGSGNIKLDANGTLIEIDGTSGKISLTGAIVDVGAGASALAALGPQLVAWLASHVHPFTDFTPVPTANITQPPAVPPPASILSTTVKIKA